MKNVERFGSEESEPKQISRRTFLKKAALGAAGAGAVVAGGMIGKKVIESTKKENIEAERERHGEAVVTNVYSGPEHGAPNLELYTITIEIENVNRPVEKEQIVRVSKEEVDNYKKGDRVTVKYKQATPYGGITVNSIEKIN